MESIRHSALPSGEDDQPSSLDTPALGDGPDTQAPGDSFVITPEDANILKGYLEEFRDADRKARKAILGRAMGELYALPRNAVFDEREAMRVRSRCNLSMRYTDNHLQKARTWFYNHYGQPHREFFKFIWRWSARNVFYQENKEEIGKLTGKISGGVPGSQAYLGALQNATTQLWKKLSTEEQEFYVNLAKEWSDKKPPKHIQAKYVTFPTYPGNVMLIYLFRMANAGYRRRIIRDFQIQLYKTCRMRSTILVAYEDEKGNIRACMYVIYSIIG